MIDITNENTTASQNAGSFTAGTICDKISHLAALVLPQILRNSQQEIQRISPIKSNKNKDKSLLVF